MRRRLPLTLLIVLIGLWFAAWGFASALAPRVVRAAIPRVMAQLEQVGVGLAELSYAAVRVSPWMNGVEIQDIHAGFDLNPRDDIRLQSMLDMRDIEVRVRNPFTLRGSVRASAFEVRFNASDLPRSLPFDRFTNGELQVGNLPLARPRQAVQEIQAKLKGLFLENRAVGDVQFSGDVKLQVDDAEMVAHLYTERDGDAFRLRFRAEDIQALSDQKGLELAPEQIELVSVYPVRVPVIMLVTNRARASARRHEPHDFWLRDAHRHVTWSYLLTRHFGPEFARKVTDAQEMKPGNTPDERAMDFHNNAIGRRLFAQGVALGALPRRVREDPDIIRHPDEVGAFGEERLLR